MAQVLTVTSRKPDYWAAPAPVESRTREFTYGLCDCGEIGICVYAHFCLCCLISENSARMDGATPCCGCCYNGEPWKNRLQAKGQFGIRLKWGCVGDCLIASCLACCSEIQIKRELDLHRYGQANQLTVNAGIPMVQIYGSPISNQSIGQTYGNPYPNQSPMGQPSGNQYQNQPMGQGYVNQYPNQSPLPSSPGNVYPNGAPMVQTMGAS